VAPAVQDVILLQDIGSAGGGPLLRLRKPFQTMVLLRVHQWRAGAMAVAERSGTSLYFLFFGGLSCKFIWSCVVSHSSSWVPRVSFLIGFGFDE
jgi:hypothetical protein